MAAQKGNLFVVEVGTGSPGSYTYSSLTSARSVDWTLNNSQVDVTTITSAGWKTLLQGAGIQDMAISVSGVWEDAAQEKTLVTAANANTFLPLKWINGNGDTFTGSFAVTSYKRAGTYNGEETYTASFASSGAITYTPGT
jgi:predicted secreted protein